MLFVHTEVVNSVTQMPHWLAPREMTRSKGATIEPLASVISLRNVEKNCQERVNTRQNRPTRGSVSLSEQARAHRQSIVLSRSFPFCSFSVLEVSQKCSQLIHMRFVPALASRLETRNHLRKRQEKNYFYF
jgi:hypothetical protein